MTQGLSYKSLVVLRVNYVMFGTKQCIVVRQDPLLSDPSAVTLHHDHMTATIVWCILIHLRCVTFPYFSFVLHACLFGYLFVCQVSICLILVVPGKVLL